MTPATSALSYQPIFNDFLYAPVDAGVDGNPLSVLSAFARLGIDPWKEAAELAEMPRDGAQRRLAGVLERLPSRPWVRTDSGPIAHRLLNLLPRLQSAWHSIDPIDARQASGDLFTSAEIRRCRRCSDLPDRSRPAQLAGVVLPAASFEMADSSHCLAQCRRPLGPARPNERRRGSVDHPTDFEVVAHEAKSPGVHDRTAASNRPIQQEREGGTRSGG